MMTYLDHFRLNEKPFKLSPDPRFMWFSETHKEAWASLHFGVLDRRGFILLVGDVGTGKTTVINKLVEGLDDSTIVARISDPGLEQLDFFKFLANQFSLKDDFRTKGDFLIEMNLFLHRAYENQKNVVVIVDEAQRLSDEMLEEIRLLSNIERPDEKLINIILVGQNELNQKLATDANRALRQRITTLYMVGPLARDEVDDFIRFRLKVAGTEEKIFSDRAVRAITEYSKGNPRLINVICDQALLTAFVQEKRRVDESIVKQCVKESAFLLPRRVKKDPDLSVRTDPPMREDALAAPTPRDPPKQQNYDSSSEKAADPIKPTAPAPRRRGLLKAGATFGVLGMLALGAVHVYHPQALERWMAPLQGFYQKHLSHFGKTSPTIPETEVDPAAAPEVPSKSRPRPQPGPKNAVPPPLQPASADRVEQVRAGESSGAATSKPEEKITDLKPAESQRPEPAKPVEAAVLPEKSTLGEAPLSPPGNIVIQFPNNSNGLDDDAFQRLDQLSEFLKRRPDARLMITGYTDARGDAIYNQNLSKFRADVIKSYFVGQGVLPGRITSIGRGQANPIASNDTLQGRGENRRVEVELIID